MGGDATGDVLVAPTARPTSAPAAAEPVVAPTYRPHLDGLRAVAVYLVVAFHAGLAVRGRVHRRRRLLRPVRLPRHPAPAARPRARARSAFAASTRGASAVSCPRLSSCCSSRGRLRRDRVARRAVRRGRRLPGRVPLRRGTGTSSASRRTTSARIITQSGPALLVAGGRGAVLPRVAAVARRPVRLTRRFGEHRRPRGAHHRGRTRRRLVGPRALTPDIESRLGVLRLRHARLPAARGRVAHAASRRSPSAGSTKRRSGPRPSACSRHCCWSRPPGCTSTRSSAGSRSRSSRRRSSPRSRSSTAVWSSGAVDQADGLPGQGLLRDVSVALDRHPRAGEAVQHRDERHDRDRGRGRDRHGFAELPDARTAGAAVEGVGPLSRPGDRDGSGRQPRVGARVHPHDNRSPGARAGARGHDRGLHSCPEGHQHRGARSSRRRKKAGRSRRVSVGPSTCAPSCTAPASACC